MGFPNPFWIGFWGILGALVAVLTVVAILGLGYFTILFARVSLTVWRKRK